jgi:hydrogenase/urease accessory protein HupE
MKKTAVLAFIFVAAAYPAFAKHHHHHHHHHRDAATVSHPRISCETVRAYVAQVGLAQAKAIAQSAGMTESEEREAAHCLEKKI